MRRIDQRGDEEIGLSAGPGNGAGTPSSGAGGAGEKLKIWDPDGLQRHETVQVSSFSGCLC